MNNGSTWCSVSTDDTARSFILTLFVTVFLFIPFLLFTFLFYFYFYFRFSPQTATCVHPLLPEGYTPPRHRHRHTCILHTYTNIQEQNVWSIKLGFFVSCFSFHLPSPIPSLFFAHSLRTF